VPGHQGAGHPARQPVEVGDPICDEREHPGRRELVGALESRQGVAEVLLIGHGRGAAERGGDEHRVDRRKLSRDVSTAVVERSRARDERADVELDVRQRRGRERGALRQHRVLAGQPQRAQGQSKAAGPLEQRPAADVAPALRPPALRPPALSLPALSWPASPASSEPGSACSDPAFATFPSSSMRMS